MKELNEKNHGAYVLYPGGLKLSEYLDGVIRGMDEPWIVLRSDSTGNRRVRAAELSALKRAVERTYEIRLSRFFSKPSYSETPGFLHRTEIRYRVTQPIVELWEFGSEPEFNVGSRGGVVAIVRARTFTDRALIATTKERAAERGHTVQVRPASSGPEG